jgi:pimeloyl-ACP methyl ester carboxylesterase
MPDSIEALRTPDARFASLPFFPFAPHYVDDLPGFEGLRLHHLDEPPAGDSCGDVYLCLHGEPTWSYLYRKMLPVFTAAGGRVVAPDWFGFGRSDKPVEDALYTFDFHRDTALRLIERLDLRNITLVCQDWGGLIGLTLPHAMPDRFSRLIVMNTGLGLGEPVSAGFDMWKTYAASTPDLPVAGLVALSSPGALNPYDLTAYDAPFPDVRYKAGVRRFPQLVPVEPGMAGIEHGERARHFWSDEWTGRSFMAIGMRDPVLGHDVMAKLRETIRGCPPPLEIAEAGHFVQEWGEPIAKAALAAFEAAR